MRGLFGSCRPAVAAELAEELLWELKSYAGAKGSQRNKDTGSAMSRKLRVAPSGLWEESHAPETWG